VTSLAAATSLPASRRAGLPWVCSGDVCVRNEWDVFNEGSTRLGYQAHLSNRFPQ